MKSWKAAYAENYICKDMEIKTAADIAAAGFDIIDAEVPGNMELDLMRAGKLEDIYYSENTLLAQKLENLHYWYFTEAEIGDKDEYLHFDGIDTIADIYVNGELACSADNMFMEYDVFADYKIGKNEILVHIKPVCIEMRKYEVSASCYAFVYNGAALYARKAPHMFGWDILPRIVSAGIWKDVTVRRKKKSFLKEVCFFTDSINREKNFAKIHAHITAELERDFASDYSLRIKGVCKDSCFEGEFTMWHNFAQPRFTVEDACLWWPKNAGEQNLYDVTVELLCEGEVIDSYSTTFGIRTTRLLKTDTTDKDGNGEFCFIINGERIFVLGTNWVPVDAIHSNDKNRIDKALALLDDIGCNMVRCWGGNVYEDHNFFDFCDRHGIMVWQDFAFGCSIYPQDDSFISRVREEAEYIVKKLRGHASLVIWAGDNEGDLVYRDWTGSRRDPKVNIITREILKKAVEKHSYTTPYLASSPYVSEKAFLERAVLPEDHLWGPRDYFKGNFYRNSSCHFASETGYHGFPSTESLYKFLKNPEKIFEENGDATREYLVHAASMNPVKTDPYAYRIRLAYTQAEVLFGEAEKELSDFVKQSQISQAEAKKYFIERFRISKGRRTGIIWWNLIDGWPQVSDAVVDYYFTKKLAYNYIKRSQTPVCMMFDEPDEKGDAIKLYCVNDTFRAEEVTYSVTDLEEGKEIMSGRLNAGANAVSEAGTCGIEKDEKKMYLIKWTVDGKEYKNHYHTNIIDIDYEKYLKQIEFCGFDEFEGF